MPSLWAQLFEVEVVMVVATVVVAVGKVPSASLPSAQPMAPFWL